MRMNTEFFCGPLFIEVTFFGETTFFCVYQFLLRAVPILVACSMMHIMYITVRKHPQFLPLFDERNRLKPTLRIDFPAKQKKQGFRIRVFGNSLYIVVERGFDF